MIECLTDEKEFDRVYSSCTPCPVDSPTCNPHLPSHKANISVQ